jgi:hypothetical protein
MARLSTAETRRARAPRVVVAAPSSLCVAIDSNHLTVEHHLMAKLYVVSLSDAERLLLQRTITKGKAPARTITRARILLKADAGREGPEWTDTKIAEAV